MHRKPITTSWVTMGLGAAVSAAGWAFLPAKFGAGILGFGLAQVMLGALDTLRPATRRG